MGTLFEGEVIKIFPETDVAAYKTWITNQGYNVIVREDYIRVGRRVRFNKYNSEKLGKLIFQHRMDMDLTHDDLSNLIKVKPDTVFEWEIGAKQPKAKNLSLLVEILDIKQEDLEKCLI